MKDTLVQTVNFYCRFCIWYSNVLGGVFILEKVEESTLIEAE